MGYIKLPLSDAAIGSVLREATASKTVTISVVAAPHTTVDLRRGMAGGLHSISIVWALTVWPHDFWRAPQNFFDVLRSVQSVERPARLW